MKEYLVIFFAIGTVMLLQGSKSETVHAWQREGSIQHLTPSDMRKMVLDEDDVHQVPIKPKSSAGCAVNHHHNHYYINFDINSDKLHRSDDGSTVSMFSNFHGAGCSGSRPDYIKNGITRPSGNVENLVPDGVGTGNGKGATTESSTDGEDSSSSRSAQERKGANTNVKRPWKETSATSGGEYDQENIEIPFKQPPDESSVSNNNEDSSSSDTTGERKGASSNIKRPWKQATDIYNDNSDQNEERIPLTRPPDGSLRSSTNTEGISTLGNTRDRQRSNIETKRPLKQTPVVSRDNPDRDEAKAIWKTTSDASSGADEVSVGPVQEKQNWNTNMEQLWQRKYGISSESSESEEVKPTRKQPIDLSSGSAEDVSSPARDGQRSNTNKRRPWMKTTGVSSDNSDSDIKPSRKPTPDSSSAAEKDAVGTYTIGSKDRQRSNTNTIRRWQQAPENPSDFYDDDVRSAEVESLIPKDKLLRKVTITPALKAEGSVEVQPKRPKEGNLYYDDVSENNRENNSKSPIKKLKKGKKQFKSVDRSTFNEDDDISEVLGVDSELPIKENGKLDKVGTKLSDNSKHKYNSRTNYDEINESSDYVDENRNDYSAPPKENVPSPSRGIKRGKARRLESNNVDNTVTTDDDDKERANSIANERVGNPTKGNDFSHANDKEKSPGDVDDANNRRYPDNDNLCSSNRLSRKNSLVTKTSSKKPAKAPEYEEDESSQAGAQRQSVSLLTANSQAKHGVLGDKNVSDGKYKGKRIQSPTKRKLSNKDSSYEYPELDKSDFTDDRRYGSNKTNNRGIVNDNENDKDSIDSEIKETSKPKVYVDGNGQPQSIESTLSTITEEADGLFDKQANPTKQNIKVIITEIKKDKNNDLTNGIRRQSSPKQRNLKPIEEAQANSLPTDTSYGIQPNEKNIPSKETTYNNDRDRYETSGVIRQLTNYPKIYPRKQNEAQESGPSIEETDENGMPSKSPLGLDDDGSSSTRPISAGKYNNPLGFLGNLQTHPGRTSGVLHKLSQLDAPGNKFKVTMWPCLSLDSQVLPLIPYHPAIHTAKGPMCL